MNRKVYVIVTLATAAAMAALVAGAGNTAHVMREHAGALLAFAAVTLVLQAVSLTGFSSSISVSGLGMLAIGFTFGIGPAMATAVLAAGVHAARRRPELHKALFNTACFTLATGASVGLYELLDGPRVVAAALASVVFVAVNIGLLTFAMAAAEQLPALATWRERLRWASPAYLAFGPLALGVAALYEQTGLVGVLALAGAAALLIETLRRTLVHVRRLAPEAA